MRIFVVALGSYNFCYAGFLLLAPYIAKKHYAHQPGSYSVFLLIMAIGGITGGILLAHQKSEIQPIRIYQEQIAYGFLSLILYLTGGYYSWLLTALSFGFVQTRLLGSLPTFIQLSTRSEYLGRVFGLAFLVFDGMQPIGNFLFGYLIDIVGAKAYLVLSLIIIISFYEFTRLDQKKVSVLGRKFGK